MIGGIQQIGDICILDFHLLDVAAIVRICRAKKRAPIPRDDEEHPPVFFRSEQKRLIGWQGRHH